MNSLPEDIPPCMCNVKEGKWREILSAMSNNLMSGMGNTIAFVGD
jgi:hypothetical protein